MLAYTVRDYADDPTDAEANFGLLRHDFSPRPAYEAFAAAARAS